jgi:HSP20 family molecular chaperone IbpA
MKSTDWILKHDLSLMFDAGGRLWRFRPNTSAHGTQPVEAHMDGTDLVVAAALTGIRPGDVDVQVNGDVLEIRGITPTAGTLACDVGLPMHADMNTIETAYSDGAFEVRVPTRALVETPAVETPALEKTAVAV